MTTKSTHTAGRDFNPANERVSFETARIELGTGNGYRWVDAVYIIRQDGTKLFPPILITEAKAICKREGWAIAQAEKGQS